VQVVVGQDLAVLIGVDHVARRATFVHAEAVGEVGHTADEGNARFE
jgi:hypothetical protein